ncbi:hypothetical protein DVS77_16480 [Mycolicibacterium moriokaense]|nr:hypothetical protein DVS77_16480 [Mycolicibacterium moriokaense]
MLPTGALIVETPREFAQLRAKEIRAVLARRQASAHIRAAERFMQTAEVHDKAADMYETMAEHQSNVEARLRAMDNRAAAKRRRGTAEAQLLKAVELAQREFRGEA